MSTEARCWYLNQKGKAAGPFAFSDLKLMAAEGRLKGHDLVYKEGSNEWKRAYDWPEIVDECFSEENASSLSRLIRLPEEERAVDEQWVLLVREEGEKEVRFRQKGPFDTDEVRRMLAEEKIKASDHIWKKGAARWVPLFEIPEFKINNQKMNRAAEEALSQVANMPPESEIPASFLPAVPDALKPTPKAAPQPVAPQPAAPQPATPQPVAPQPAAPETQSVREWALNMVKSAEARGDSPVPAAGKAQIFMPEVTRVNVEAPAASAPLSSVSEPLADLADVEEALEALDVDDGKEEWSSAPAGSLDEDEGESTRYVPSNPAVGPLHESATPPVIAAEPAPPFGVIKEHAIDREPAIEAKPATEAKPAVLPVVAPKAVDAKPQVSENWDDAEIEKTADIVLPLPVEASTPVEVAPLPVARKSVPAHPPAPQPVAPQPVAPQPVAPQPVAPKAKAAAVPADYSAYDFEPPQSLLSKATPVLAILLVGVFGAGVWATLNTDRSALQRPNANLGYQVQPITPENLPLESASQSPPPAEMPAPNTAPVVFKPESADPNMAPGPDSQARVAEAEKAVGVASPASNVAAPPAAAPQPASSPTMAASPSKGSVAQPPVRAAEPDGKNPQVRVNEAQTYVEILGPFKKSDLLRIRLEGKSGQILDLPALVLKYEVRAPQDFYYRISIKDARIPKGEYQVAVQYGVNRFTRGLSYGKDAQFSTALNAHRKMMSYDQQQEKKRLLRATRELASFVDQAENQMQNATAVKKILRDMDKKAPKEMRQVRGNRYQLFFGDSWEKLATQWDKALQTLKENPGRNPASVDEISKTRRAALTLEGEVRNMSMWD